MKKSSKFLLFAAVAVLLPSASAHATTPVGAIYACYSCSATGDTAVDAALVANPSVAGDGLLFKFVNTSGSAITGGTFNLTAGSYTDSFLLPTIAANASYIFLPGISNDGGIHPAGSLFASTGSTMDTSDGVGGVTDSSAFSFLGTSGALSVTSGTFRAGDAGLIRPYRDNPQNGSTSFLGNGPSGDGGCNNCYFAQIASLTVPSLTGAVPEPSTWAMMLLGFGGIGASMRRRRTAASSLQTS